MAKKQQPKKHVKRQNKKNRDLDWYFSGLPAKPFRQAISASEKVDEKRNNGQ